MLHNIFTFCVPNFTFNFNLRSYDKGVKVPDPEVFFKVALMRMNALGVPADQAGGLLRTSTRLTLNPTVMRTITRPTLNPTVFRTSYRPTLNLSNVYMSILPEGKSCSDLGLSARCH